MIRFAELPPSFLLVLSQCLLFASAAPSSFAQRSNGSMSTHVVADSAHTSIGSVASKTYTRNGTIAPTTALDVQTTTAASLSASITAAASLNKTADSTGALSLSDPKLEALRSCDSSWGDWNSGYLAFSSLHASSRLVSSARTSLISDMSCVGPTTTLCDGAPRCLGHEKSTKTTTYQTTFYDSSAPTYSAPKPTCTVDAAECRGLWGAWNTLQSQNSTHAMNMPYCSERQGWGDWQDHCGGCFISASTMRLVYWPVSVSNQNPCGSGSTESPSAPSTAVFQGRTLTPPYVYLSFDALSARGTGSTVCGGTYTNVLVPVRPTDVSSFRGEHAWAGDNGPAVQTQAYSFNYADLNHRTLNNSISYPLVPKEAYDGQQRCYPDGCTAIFDDYNPIVGFRNENVDFAKIDPKWGSCSFDFSASLDPPLPLTLAGNLNVTSPPRTNVAMQTAEASPGITPRPHEPTRTLNSSHAEVTGVPLVLSDLSLPPGTTVPQRAHMEQTVEVGPTTEPLASASHVAYAEDGQDDSGDDSREALAGVIVSILDPVAPVSSTDANGGNAASSFVGPAGAGGKSALEDSESGSSTNTGPGSEEPGSSSDSDPSRPPLDQHLGPPPGPSSDPPSDPPSGKAAVISNPANQHLTVSQVAGSSSLYSIYGVGTLRTVVTADGNAATIGGMEISVRASASGNGADVLAKPTGVSPGEGAEMGSWSTFALSSAVADGPEAIFTPGPEPGMRITASQIAPGTFVIPGLSGSAPVTLSAGGEGFIISGVSISAGSSGVIVGGSTTVTASASTPETGFIMTVTDANGDVRRITAVQVSGGVFVIPEANGHAAMTISEGGKAVTIDGTTFSAVGTGLIGIVDGKTKTTVPVSTAATPTRDATGLGRYATSELGEGGKVIATGINSEVPDGAGSKMISNILELIWPTAILTTFVIFL